MPHFIGIMSGTSLDSIDAALCEFPSSGKPRLLAHHQHPFPTALRRTLVALCQPGDNEIESMGRADRELGQCYADAVLALLDKTSFKTSDITAIGCHGQTIRHRPASTEMPAASAFTLQIGDPNTLASRTGIAVVSDLRRRDIAEGGQGAPLAPGFHQAVFSAKGRDRAIINIGGMANITLLPARGDCQGFDTGPGNVLMDAWIQAQRSSDYDEGGRWAASGECCPDLLEALLALPYFRKKTGPRSTGREDFNAAKLESVLAGLTYKPKPEDVQATLLEFTAQTIASPLLELSTRPSQAYICGGGAYNTVLMQRLETLLHPTLIASTEQLGIAPQWVEAMAFAWLAHRRIKSLSGNLPSVTGASHPAVLGGIYSA